VAPAGDPANIAMERVLAMHLEGHVFPLFELILAR